MRPGFNHNVRHQDKVFHVQTEDNGLKAPDLVTQVFLGGQLVAIERASYAELLTAGFDDKERDAHIQKRMQAQHKRLLKCLVSGQYDAKIAGFNAAQPANHPSKPVPISDDITPESLLAPGAVLAKLDEPKPIQEDLRDDDLLTLLEREINGPLGSKKTPTLCQEIDKEIAKRKVPTHAPTQAAPTGNIPGASAPPKPDGRYSRVARAIENPIAKPIAQLDPKLFESSKSAQIPKTSPPRSSAIKETKSAIPTPVPTPVDRSIDEAISYYLSHTRKK